MTDLRAHQNALKAAQDIVDTSKDQRAKDEAAAYVVIHTDAIARGGW
jgi:hypothetical protein